MPSAGESGHLAVDRTWSRAANALLALRAFLAIMGSLLKNLHLARHHATAAGSGARGPWLPGEDAMGWTLVSVTIPLIMEWRTASATVLVQLSNCAHPLLHTAMATF